jgi:UTP--glucose-1-phosphate uridylyltransferase
VIDTALIPAAGLGTRLRPATAVIPKVLMPLLDVPAIQLVVEEALHAGLTRVVLVVGHGKELIQAHFDATDGPWSGRLVYVPQPQQEGLGHAIACGRPHVGENPFVVMFGDSVFAGGNPTRELVNDYSEHGEAVLGAQEVPLSQSPKRGMLQAEASSQDRMRIEKIVEKPRPEQAPSRLAMAGRLILHPTIFPALDRVKRDQSGEIQLTPALNELARSEALSAIRIAEPRLDIGNRASYLEAILAFAEARYDLRMPRRATDPDAE